MDDPQILATNTATVPTNISVGEEHVIDPQQEETVIISKGELEKIKKTAEEYLDGWKRAKADYINFKRETEEHRTQFAQFAVMGLLIEVIPLYDHLRQAVRHVPEERMKEPWIGGIVNIVKEFEAALKHAGVEAMNTVDAQFDPLCHEAIGREIRPDVPNNSIVQEVKTGYTLNGKVFIPAQVIVNGKD